MSYTYDVLVIGGGAAGLTASGLAANFGAKTMLVEADRLGGDCTWTGCIPSKTLLHAAKTVQNAREAARFGLVEQVPEINFEQLMQYVKQVRQEVYEDADHPEIFRNMGIEVQEGSARFKDPHTVLIETPDQGEIEISSKFIILATGSRAMTPPISGIKEVDYLTNDTLFEIDNLPEELIVVGAGPVGVEMGQALNRLGSRVTIIDQADGILTKDDPELTGRLQKILEKEGIEFWLNRNISAVTPARNGQVELEVAGGEVVDQRIKGSHLLLATGRRPNIKGLELENAGVEYTGDGITIDDRCRTSQKHIYGCGDVTGRYQFTHMSEHMAKVAVSNALLKFPQKIDADHVPWCTYTDPELAHVGARHAELEKASTSFNTYRFPFDMIDRAITDGQTEGLIKVFARRRSGKILGVTILGAHSGEMISEYALAMRQGITLRQISDTIHPYPTYGLGNRRAADQWYVQNQSEWMIKGLQKIFGYRGSIPDVSDPDRIV